ncbi:MAG: DNA-processing protein DprA, partial [Gammaproteobacteria bacterium]
SSKTQAILLLTTHFTGKGSGAETHKPLTSREWGRFAEWLHQQNRQPEDLLNRGLDSLLTGWQDKSITIERLQGLLNRGSALALSLEKWTRGGLWVITRAEADYPRRLKQRLRSDSPAVLFGCGNRALLNAGGLAVVGSRKVDEQALDYSRDVGLQAAGANTNIVSGAAKGVDETAMLSVLDAGGCAVGVMADSLLRASSSAKYRQFLLDDRLALVTPFNPESGFNAGNAMQRNKYIYCLADAALAVHSGQKGGTWTGVQENLRQRWVPMWVRETTSPEAGNSLLIKAGAMPAPASKNDIDVPKLLAAELSAPPASLELPGLSVAENAVTRDVAYFNKSNK